MDLDAILGLDAPPLQEHAFSKSFKRVCQLLSGLVAGSFPAFRIRADVDYVVRMRLECATYPMEAATRHNPNLHESLHSTYKSAENKLWLSNGRWTSMYARTSSMYCFYSFKPFSLQTLCACWKKACHLLVAAPALRKPKLCTHRYVVISDSHRTSFYDTIFQERPRYHIWVSALPYIGRAALQGTLVDPALSPRVECFHRLTFDTVVLCSGFSAMTRQDHRDYLTKIGR